jgi:AhpC/TSA family
MKGETHMLRKQTVGLLFVGVLLASGPVLGRFAWAIDIGDKAPDFTLPSTNGIDISLSDFKGKRFVLLEFYAADFVPA